MEAAAVRTTLRAGEVLFSQGEPGDSIYVIERGEIEISVYANDGRKLALDILRGGEVFGEIALFGGDRTATAAALDDCVLRRIRRSRRSCDASPPPRNWRSIISRRFAIDCAA